LICVHCWFVIFWSKQKFEIRCETITTKKALIMRAFLVVKSDEAERAEFETEQREGRRISYLISLSNRAFVGI